VIADAPSWLVEVIKRKSFARVRADNSEEWVIEPDQESSINWAIKFLTEDAEPAVMFKGGDNRTYKTAKVLREQGISEDMCFALMLEHYNDRCDPPWSYEGLATKVRNAYTYKSDNPAGGCTAEYEFGLDPIDPDDIKTEGNLEQIERDRLRRQELRDAGIRWARTQVMFDPNNLPVSVHDTVQAVKKDTANAQIFSRGGRLCRILKDSDEGNLDRKRGSLVIRDLVKDDMMVRMAQAAVFKQRGKDKEKLAGVPDQLVRAMMAAEYLRQFDRLDGVIEAPTMLLDGTIIDKPGYDKASGLYYDKRNIPDMPEIATVPSPIDAEVALEVLREVLDEFKFEDSVSESAALAAILAGCVRRVLPMCPVILIDAPGQSNGKTLLADLIATIPTGRGAGATQWPNEVAEQRKTLTSILLAGDAVVNFDNVVAAVGGPAICNVTTAQESYKDRQLGQSQMLALPANVLWLFTGNNMTVKDDMSSRVLRVRLDARCENPKLRVFNRPDLLGYVRANRGKLIHAALTILKAYIAAGRPTADLDGNPFTVPSRFNEFGSLIAAALVWLRLPDPLTSQEGVVDDDPVREARAAILSAWQTRYGFGRWVTAKNLRDDCGHVLDAINEIVGGGTSQNATASKLKTLEGLIINGVKLESRKAAPNKPRAWQLVDCDPERLSFLGRY
jgi:putative DNA primase/helicase